MRDMPKVKRVADQQSGKSNEKSEQQNASAFMPLSNDLVDGPLFTKLSSADRSIARGLVNELENKLSQSDEIWLETGVLLNRLKGKAVGRGKMREICAAFSLEPRSAQQRMRAATDFAEDVATASILTSKSLITLSGDCNKGLRTAVIAMLKSGVVPTHRDIEKMAGKPDTVNPDTYQPDEICIEIAQRLVGSLSDFDPANLLEKLTSVKAAHLRTALIDCVNELSVSLRSKDQKKQPENRTAVH